MSFLHEQLPGLEKNMLVDTGWITDFSAKARSPTLSHTPERRLQFVSGVLHARYGDVEILANGPDADRICSLPDPENPLATVAGIYRQSVRPWMN